MGGSVCLDPSNPEDLWPYCPSYAAAVLFAVLFGLAGVLHVFQGIKYRKPFTWVIVVAAAWELVGFAFRIVSTQNETQLGYYLAQILLSLTAPIWINAFVYMVLGRMVQFFVADHKVLGVQARRLTACFVILDVAAFLVQAMGGGLLGSSDVSVKKLGFEIYMGGIGLQQAGLLLFLSLTIAFHRKVRAVENVRPTEWKGLLYVVYAIILLITARIIYRFVEFGSTSSTTVGDHEAYFYCLDALPMFTAIVLFNAVHPGRVLVGSESEFEKKSRRQKKEEKAQRKEAKRQRKEVKKQGQRTVEEKRGGESV